MLKVDMENHSDLLGKKYIFDDGNTIEVIQLKTREDGIWVHYCISMHDSLPRKLIMKHDEFMNKYQHLFENNHK